MSIDVHYSKQINRLVKFISYSLGAITLVAITVIAVTWYFFTPDHDVFKRERFNKKLWQEDTLANQLSNPKDCQRGRMAQHVIDTIRNAHLTRSKVVDMLGEPDKSNLQLLQYDIGWCGYIDPNTLDIEFLEDDHLHEARIVNH